MEAMQHSRSTLRVERKLAAAEAGLAEWERLAASPKLSFRAELAARNMVTSYQAGVLLYLRALAYERRKLGTGALMPEELRLYAA